MPDVDATTPGDARLAYAISATATLLWVGCVFPAADGVAVRADDAATPFFRTPWMLVPPLVVLILGPVGVTLARTRLGLRAVLATTDAFVALIATFALLGHGVVEGPVSGVLVGALLAVGVLSVVEASRILWQQREDALPPWMRGLRFVIVLLVLLMPAWLLVQDGRELASLLAPFLPLAFGAGGALLARGAAGLRLSTALVHLVLAAHVLVTLRWTIYEGRPPIPALGHLGRATLVLAIVVLVLAGLRVVRLFRAGPAAAGVAPAAPGA